MTRADDAAWQLVPASTAVRIWLVLLTAVLPIAITGVALGFATMEGGEMSLIGDSLPLTIGVTLVGIALIGGGIAFVVDRSMRRHRIAVDPDGIEVATTFYRRRLGWSELLPDQARVANLDEHTEFKPTYKSNGTSLPGFRSGWFRLRNRQKALVAMAGGPRVVWIPTTKGYGLVLQPRQPQALLDLVRERGGRR